MWYIATSKEQCGLPGWVSGKESTCNAGISGEAGSVPKSERCHGGGHGNPHQYSFLENLMDRGAWWATVHRVTKSWTRVRQFSTHSGEFRYHPTVLQGTEDFGGHILCAGPGSHPFQKGSQETGRQAPGMLLVLVFPSSLSTWVCC